MKSAEILLTFMDRLQLFIERINGYIEKGIEIFLKVREWIQKILGYIEQGIGKLVDAIGGRPNKDDLLEFQQDDLFV